MKILDLSQCFNQHFHWLVDRFTLDVRPQTSIRLEVGSLKLRFTGRSSPFGPGTRLKLMFLLTSSFCTR